MFYKGDTMNKVWTSIKRNKTMIIFLLSIFIIGAIFGVFYYIQQSDVIKNGIKEGLTTYKTTISKTNINLFVKHIFLLTAIFLLSYTIIGNVLSIFYLFYEGIILGFSTAIFIANYKFSGLIFNLISFILTKALFITSVIFISIVALKITKKIIYTIISKKGESFYELIRFNILKLFIILAIVLISDLFIFFLSNKILSFLTFLLA